MWQLDNRTPFAAERGWVRDRDGQEIWLVAVKCTFDIRPGDGNTHVTQVAQEQPPVLRLPEHHGEPGKSSIKYDADLVLTKTTTDILLVGNAHAPGGRPVRQMDVGLRVGPLQKLLRVFGDRHWGALGPSKPEPFTSMPLVYERAYGGVDPHSRQPEVDWDWRNPVGVGFAAASSHTKDQPLPNIEYPKQLISGWRDRPPPAGFGAIASHWQPRMGLAGTYDAHWEQTRAPLLAADMDERCYQSAPTDQQAPSFLRGGEAVALVGLSPAGPLHFSLPRVYLGFETLYYDGSRQVHPERKLHSVILEPDHAAGPRLSLVWHSALPCHWKGHKLDRTRITLKTPINGQPAATREAEPAHG